MLYIAVLSALAGMYLDDTNLLLNGIFFLLLHTTLKGKN